MLRCEKCSHIYEEGTMHKCPPEEYVAQRKFWLDLAIAADVTEQDEVEKRIPGYPKGATRSGVSGYIF